MWIHVNWVLHVARTVGSVECLARKHPFKRHIILIFAIKLCFHLCFWWLLWKSNVFKTLFFFFFSNFFFFWIKVRKLLTLIWCRTWTNDNVLDSPCPNGSFSLIFYFFCGLHHLCFCVLLPHEKYKFTLIFDGSHLDKTQCNEWV